MIILKVLGFFKYIEIKKGTMFFMQRSQHLKNIFADEELEEKVVSSILELTTQHGAIKGETQTKQVKFYNLDAIIAVANTNKQIKDVEYGIFIIFNFNHELYLQD